MSLDTIKTIGILGAGKLGIVLGQLFINAGYNVYIAGSGSPKKIALTTKILVPGAHAVDKETAAQQADIVVLALPLGKYKSIPKDALKGKIVIDAMNYWWEVDGNDFELGNPGVSTSEAIQNYLPHSRVVKAFSHVGYHELHDEPRLKGDPERKAIAVAGNPEDAAFVSELIDRVGFDSLYIGDLSKGRLLQPHGKVFGVHVDIDTLKKYLSEEPSAGS